MLKYIDLKKHSREDWPEVIRADFELWADHDNPQELMDSYLILWDEIRFVKPVQEKALRELNYNLLACIQLCKEKDE